MIEPIYLPVYALFIGSCSAFVGTFYMNALPAFPLTVWWWQYMQRWETKRPNLFKVLSYCSDCFSGHLGWISSLYFALRYFALTWKDIPTVAFSVLLAAGAGYLFSVLLNDYLTDLKKRNGNN